MHGVIVVANFRATFTPETVYYHLDPLGSVRAVTSAAGAVVERHDYRPFGEDNMPLPAPGADPSRFLGQQRDQTKLDQFGARYYSMFTGRFTGVDPVINAGAVASPQRWNRYAYALNDPLRFTDASGLDSEDLQQAPEKPSKCPAGQLCFRGGVAEAWIPDLYFLCYQVPLLCGGGRSGRDEREHKPDRDNDGDVGSGLAVITVIAIVEPTPAVELVIGASLGAAAVANIARAGAEAPRALPAVSRSFQLTQSRLEHIVGRHWPTSGTRGAGLFGHGTTARTLLGMIDEAIQRGSIRANTLGRPGEIFEARFGHIIGNGRSGQPTDMLRVVRNPDGTIRTAFPCC